MKITQGQLNKYVKDIKILQTYFNNQINQLKSMTDERIKFIREVCDFIYQGDFDEVHEFVEHIESAQCC